MYHAFSSFLFSTAVQYLMIPREEVELDDVTSYNIFDNKIYKISSYSLHTLTQLWLTSQDTSPLLNKVTHAPSDILIGQTRSPNSSPGLPKYLMMHSPFCSINVTYWTRINNSVRFCFLLLKIINIFLKYIFEYIIK